MLFYAIKPCTFVIDICLNLNMAVEYILFKANANVAHLHAPINDQTKYHLSTPYGF